MKKVLLSFTILLMPILLAAQSPELRRHWSVCFDEAQSSWEPDASFRAFTDSLLMFNVDSIAVDGFASPSGRETFNLELSRQRAEIVADSLRMIFPTVPITVTGHSEDWETLARLVSESDLAYKDELKEIFSGERRDIKLRLKRHRGGKTYRELFDLYFRSLRRTDVLITFTVKEEYLPYFLIMNSVTDTLSVAPLSGNPEKAPGVRPAGEQDRPAEDDASGAGSSTERLFILNLRSNLLVPLTNIGLEIPVAKGFTIGGDFYSPWFGFDEKNRNCFELQCADVEIRKWFRQNDIPGFSGNPFTGHSVYVGAIAGHYDFEWDYSGFQGEVVSAYVGYDYSFTVWKKARISVGLALGYARLNWRDYSVWFDGGKLIRMRPIVEHRKDWGGPVKAGVSLTLPLTIKKEVNHEN